MSTEQNKVSARRWFLDIITQGRLDVADEIFAANHIIHDPHAPLLKRTGGGRTLRFNVISIVDGSADSPAHRFERGVLPQMEYRQLRRLFLVLKYHQHASNPQLWRGGRWIPSC
jgi:hypothetical protein